MTLFRESGLSFRFDANWIVKKYDAHRYYSYLSGAGLKGMDFAGIREETAYLFEVKNYSIRFEGKPYYKIYGLIEDPEELIRVVVRKVEDTRRGIRIVHNYLSRKWLYRWLYPYLSKWRLPDRAKNTWWFWAKLYYLLEEQQAGIVVLWMVVDLAYDGYDEEQVKAFLVFLEKRLTQVLSGQGVQFVLVMVDNGVELEGLEVK